MIELDNLRKASQIGQRFGNGVHLPLSLSDFGAHNKVDCQKVFIALSRRGTLFEISVCGKEIDRLDKGSVLILFRGEESAQPVVLGGHLVR